MEKKTIGEKVRELQDQGLSFAEVIKILAGDVKESDDRHDLFRLWDMNDDEVKNYVDTLKEKYTKMHNDECKRMLEKYPNMEFVSGSSTYVRNAIIEETHYDHRVLDLLEFDEPWTMYGVMTEVKVIQSSIDGGGACPTQYEFDTSNGKRFYFRLRWGEYSLEILDKNGEIQLFNGKIIAGYDAQSCKLFGECTWEDAKELLKKANFNIVEIN